jgi:hypothetical protein
MSGFGAQDCLRRLSDEPVEISRRPLKFLDAL